MYLIKKKLLHFKENKITDQRIFLNRRKVILGLMGSIFSANCNNLYANSDKNNYNKVIKRNLTSFENISDKSIFLEDILKKVDIEERVYKFRCVEAWSMVVPWKGFQLSKLIKILDPKSDTKYVEFETFFRPAEANNQKQGWYPWPYKEIITIKEAMHPLSFIATGVYGKPLPKQNGAPIRLVLPWKYGFKSIKSIVKINFSNTKTKSFWETIAPKEYGFWANVNPAVPHRRWSQEYEKDIDTGDKYRTLLFNGYGEWVSSLYANVKNKSIFY